MDEHKDTAVLLRWKILMAKRNPARAIAVAVIVLICTYFVFLTLQEVLLTVIALIVLLLMVLPYYLPMTYILTAEEVIKKMPFFRQKRRWEEFRRYDTSKNAIKLYTMSHVSRLDNYRSLLIICPNNHDRVLEIIQRKISNEAEEADSES